VRWWNAPQERHAIAFPFLNPEHSCSSDRALSGSLERVGDGTAGTGRSNRAGQGPLASADSSLDARGTSQTQVSPAAAGLLPAGLAADTDS